ncbi:DUF2306 domain-containing protein [Sphingomonas ginsenosidivorax]|nr:DUF2306 domain-containing protein [Sphingomonas ginsenosidivorax]
MGAAHFAMGSVALVSGAVVLMLPKGTARHRRVGKVYAAAILAINGTALSMYDLTGRPNVFHVIALVNLATLAMGLLALRRWRWTREPSDLVTHQRRMAMNYVGLWMAFITELLVNPMLGVSRISDPRSHWPLMIALNLALFSAGGWLVRTRLTATTVRA